MFVEWMDGENHWQNTFLCISPFINFKNTLYHIFIVVLNRYFVLILFLNLRLQQIRKCHITTVGISETSSKKKQSPKIENLILSVRWFWFLSFAFFSFLNQGDCSCLCKFYIPVWHSGCIANSSKLLNCTEM